MEDLEALKNEIKQNKDVFAARLGQIQDSHFDDITQIKAHYKEELKAKHEDVRRLKEKLKLVMDAKLPQTDDKSTQKSTNFAISAHPSPVNVLNQMVNEVVATSKTTEGKTEEKGTETLTIAPGYMSEETDSAGK